MTVTNVAVAITKFLFGMCDCMVSSDVGTAIFDLYWGFTHVRARAHAIGRISEHGLHL